ncbi:MAG: hypothetical protein GY773_33100, partial [Actinomycetia bacterium]|nr:hypothetical protein [Actinomycetes bacterium]
MDDHELDDRIRSAVASLTRTAPEPLPLPHSITEVSDEAAQGQGARHRLNGRPWPGRAWVPRGRRQLVLAAASLLAVAIGIGGAVAVVNDGGDQTIATATDFVAPDGRLYLLPAADVDLTGGADYSTEPAVDEGSAIVVGRPTATGFEAIVAVAHLTTGPTS